LIQNNNKKPSSDLLITTEDGSQTLISPIFGERYHSIYGAKTESEIVFIDAGFRNQISEAPLHILEMGMGTGLNAYMTWIEAEKNGVQVYYEAYEKFPVEKPYWTSIGYQELFESDFPFNKIHSSNWNEVLEFSHHFQFQKINQDILKVEKEEFFNVIYFDAFAPGAQEELWTKSIFDLMFKSLKNNGVLVTYCAKGYVKRNLKAAGFKIEALPGPPGKREMTRARKLI